VSVGGERTEEVQTVEEREDRARKKKEGTTRKEREIE
jgi:hypothetical protein